MKTPYSRTLLVSLVVAVLAITALELIVPRSPLETPLQAQQFRAPIVCDQAVAVSMSTATTTEMVALTAGQRVQVCGFALSAGGATTAKLVRGTGANCGTSTTDITAPFEFADNSSLVYGNGVGTVVRLPTGTALCITTSQAVALSGVITYTKF
jgi:hypothetical protein